MSTDLHKIEWIRTAIARNHLQGVFPNPQDLIDSIKVLVREYDQQRTELHEAQTEVISIKRKTRDALDEMQVSQINAHARMRSYVK